MKIFLKISIGFLIITLALLVIVFCYFFVGKTPIAENITWGVDFSQMQAQSLGLDWKNTYLATINELGAKNIKIHTQWDWIEGEKNEYYFNDVDWQLAQAKDKGVKIIYVVGVKSGRWPECHIPQWAQNLSEEQQKNAILSYIKEVVQRYKDNGAVEYWQVENEPLFRFGECPSWYYKNNDFLKQEVALVKSLDPSRKVIISDSGENSTWFGVAKIGDIVGTTMYREVWAHITDKIGFNMNPLVSQITYWRKAQIIKKIFGKNVICVELQAEPWASKPFYNVPINEQLKTMNLNLFKKNVEFAKSTGLDKFYFWGVEWWYWMKTVQNQPAIWNEAKSLF